MDTPITSTPRTVECITSTEGGADTDVKFSISVVFIQGEETMQMVWKFETLEEQCEAYAMWENIIFSASEHNSAVEEEQEEDEVA